jgi:hypothetical protein
MPLFKPDGFVSKLKDFDIDKLLKQGQTKLNNTLSGVKLPEVQTNIKLDAKVYAMIAGVLIAIYLIFKKKNK